MARSLSHPEEYQALVHEQAWAALRDRPFLWGRFVWCLFDFAADSRNEGDHPGRNDKGLVTYDRRIRKDAFYWYKANWSDEPFVHITDQRFTPRTSAAAEIKAYSNAPVLEATLNGADLGPVRSADHIFRWSGLRLAAGENHVTVRAPEGSASGGGLPVEDACTWILKQAVP
jgi:beta-galactosidase